MKRIDSALHFAILLIVLMNCACGNHKIQPVQQVEITGSKAKEYFVSDYASLLTWEQYEEVRDLVDRHNKIGPGKLYLCTINRLPEQTTIEQYAAHRINQKPLLSGEKKDRVLLLVVKEERRLRIETSRDVWDLLTDDDCQHINREVMVPRFRQNEFYLGVKEGVLAIVEKLEKKSGSPPLPISNSPMTNF